MSDLAAYRRFYAEEIQLASNIRTPALVEALAAVPRERFLPPGPWTIRSDTDFGQPPRQTPDADPRHVHHNIAVGIDPARMLFNGAPGLIARAIDVLDLKPGARVLHVGTGTGYFTALVAHCAGPTGRVVGIEVDADLAAKASDNLASMPWVRVRQGDASGPLEQTFDAILVNAGVTHPLDTWLDALAPGGRIVLPITATMDAMGNIGKGLLLLVTRGTDHAPLATDHATPATDHATPATDHAILATDHTDHTDPGMFTVRPITFVAIYSAMSIRDAALNAEIGKALTKHPFPPIKTLRRDAHERTGACWLHTPGMCFSL